MKKFLYILLYTTIATTSLAKTNSPEYIIAKGYYDRIALASSNVKKSKYRLTLIPNSQTKAYIYRYHKPSVNAIDIKKSKDLLKMDITDYRYLYKCLSELDKLDESQKEYLRDFKLKYKQKIQVNYKPITDVKLNQKKVDKVDVTSKRR